MDLLLKILSSKLRPLLETLSGFYYLSISEASSVMPDCLLMMLNKSVGHHQGPQ